MPTSTATVGNFYNLEETIKYMTEGEKHSIVTEFGDDVLIRQPGKYAGITDGGDFVVDTLIGDRWVPLRHADYFDIVSEMVGKDPEWCRNKLGPALVMLSKGTLTFEDIDKIPGGPRVRNINPRTLLRTLLLIMVAEHRRAAFAEPVGGRNLIVRFLLGIIYGAWEADEAKSYIKEGKPGLKKLRWRNHAEPTFNEVLKGVT